MAQAEAARDAAARPSASAAGEMHEGLRAALELEVALGAEDETAGACKARGDDPRSARSASSLAGRLVHARARA